MGLIITLIIVGIILITAEIILIPGIFITGIIGVGALVASCFHAFREFGTTAGIIVILVNIVLTTLATVFSLRAKTWKRFSLDTEIDSRTDSRPEEKGLKKGDEGVTLTRLGPTGKVLFGNTVTEATARNGMIAPQQKVEILQIEENRIIVKTK